MVPLESRNNPFQELLPSVDKTSNPQNSAELEAGHFDVLKPHVGALLGFAPEVVLTVVENTSSVSSVPQPISIDIDQVKAARRKRFEQTGYVPPISGGALDGETGTEIPNQHGNRSPASSDQVGAGGTRNTEKKQFIWSEDLSENGQKLYLLLLNDIGLTGYLPELAQLEGIDLGVGLEELRQLDILDESKPEIIRISAMAQSGV